MGYYNYYKVAFQANGKSKYDIYLEHSAQDAVDKCREEHAYIGDYRTERVWKDTGEAWEVTEAWE